MKENICMYAVTARGGICGEPAGADDRCQEHQGMPPLFTVEEIEDNLRSNPYEPSNKIREGKEHLGGVKPRPKRQRPDGSPGAEPRSISESEEKHLLSAGIDILECRYDPETDTDEVIGIKQAPGRTNVYRDVNDSNLQLIREAAQHIAATSAEPESVNIASVIGWLVDAIEGDEGAVITLRQLGVDWRY